MAGVHKVTYLLACLHYVSGPETLVSGILYCPYDKDHSQIIAVQVEEWRATCKDCRFARWAGMSKDNAGLFVTGHMRRNRGHVAYREYAENLAAKVTAEKFEAWNHGPIRST